MKIKKLIEILTELSYKQGDIEVNVSNEPLEIKDGVLVLNIDSQIYYTTCEWDMGWNIDDYNSIYTSKEELEKDLNSKNWKEVGYDTWQEAQGDGLLTIVKK